VELLLDPQSVARTAGLELYRHGASFTLVDSSEWAPATR
jgi:hypothetical protein